MAVDLVFSQSPLTGPSWNLLFGDEGGGEVTPARSFTLVGTLPPLTFAAAVKDLKRFTFAATLPPMTFVAQAVYDIAVVKNAEGNVRGPHQPARRPREATSAAWGTSASKRGGTDMVWQTAERAELDAAAAAGLAHPVYQVGALSWGLGRPLSRSDAARHQRADPRRADNVAAWQRAAQLRYLAALRYQAAINRRRTIEGSAWAAARRINRDMLAPAGASRRYSERDATVPYQAAWWPRTGFHPVVTPPAVDPCYVPSPDLLFDALWPGSVHLVFVCERDTAGPPATVVVPVRRVYIVLNQASLTRVDGNIALPALSMSMSLDATSWAWSFNATLPASALPDLEPATATAPVEVQIGINGANYRMIVERRSRTRTFGQASIAISGRSRNALLDGPYAPEMSFANTLARTAQQLAGDVLTDNGVPIGWAVDWGLTDWLVPAGVFSHQGRYVSALNAIAAAAAGYVQPHNTALTVRVLPSYPALPWAWGTVTPDYELPAAVTTQESVEWLKKPQYNRVFVSGAQAGILGQVTRVGSAGDLVAPMVTDPLITHADAARQRGGAILADTGNQAMVGLRLPVLAETGIILPGKFARYVDGATTRLGLVRDVKVDVAMPDIWQQITVETHV